MEYRTGDDYVELNWADADIDPFPNGLEELVAANARLERSLSGVPDRRAEQASRLRLPLRRDQIFANLGLMLGIFPPATIFLAILFSQPDWSPFSLLMLFSNASTALVGHRFGKVVSRMVGYIERQSTGEYIILSVFIGALWGIVAGGLGGLFLFLVGGIFGAVLGGLVGAIALPAFLVPYNAVRQGESIALSHFMPIAVGINAVICASILHFLFQ